MSKILKIKKEIEVEIDKEVGAAYIYIGPKQESLKGGLKSEPLNEDIVIDYSPDGKLYGIEILNLKLLDLSEEL